MLDFFPDPAIVEKKQLELLVMRERINSDLSASTTATESDFSESPTPSPSSLTEDVPINKWNLARNDVTY